MSFGPIQFGGLASGLDTASIITALVGAESIPLQTAENQKSEAQQKINLLGTFEGLLNTLKEKAEALATADEFVKQQVSVSEEGFATVGVTGATAEGSHTLQVTALAAVDRYHFSGVIDPDAALSSGTLAFDYDGQSYSFDTGGTASLNDLADDINAQMGDSVTASVVNTGTSASPSYELVIAGDETGASKTLSFTTTSIAELGAGTQIGTASNAEIIVDGLTVQREDNDFSDVLEGISIQALAQTTGEITFTVDPDTTAIKDGIQEMVDAYNAVIGFINTQNEYSEDGGAGGLLFGDSALSSAQSSMYNALFNVDLSTVQNDTTGFSTLGLVGIDLNLDGTLSIDDSTLDDKMAEDLDAFVDLFTDSDGFDNGDLPGSDPNFYVDTTADTGLADDLARAIDALLEDKETPSGSTVSGLIKSKTDSLNAQIKLYDDQIESLEFNLEKFEESLVSKFTALEELMSGLNAQGAFLSQALVGLTPG